MTIKFRYFFVKNNNALIFLSFGYVALLIFMLKMIGLGATSTFFLFLAICSLPTLIAQSLFKTLRKTFRYGTLFFLPHFGITVQTDFAAIIGEHPLNINGLFRCGGSFDRLILIEDFFLTTKPCSNCSTWL